VMCYTVLIWTLFLLTLGNNISLQSFNLPKPVHYVRTGKINAFVRICIRIRIWRILKVKIPIWWMQILTNFITSLLISTVDCMTKITVPLTIQLSLHRWREAQQFVCERELTGNWLFVHVFVLSNNSSVSEQLFRNISWLLT